MNASDGVAPAVRSILEAARERPPPDGGRISVTAREFPGAVERAAADGDVPIIAEVKPTSPTAEHRRDEDPVSLAEAMVEGGATALSVLTEPDHFGGSPTALRQVRDAVDVPVLRKDFVLTPEQLDVVAADLVLVIARFVDDVGELVAAAQDRGFQVLVEVHDRAEVDVAVDSGADVIGINNRDLAELSVDLGTFERVAPAVPDDVTVVAESGITTPEDVRRMRNAGADALLVGSAIMAEEDVTAGTRRLVEAER